MTRPVADLYTLPYVFQGCVLQKQHKTCNWWGIGDWDNQLFVILQCKISTVVTYPETWLFGLYQRTMREQVWISEMLSSPNDVDTIAEHQTYLYEYKWTRLNAAWRSHESANSTPSSAYSIVLIHCETPTGILKAYLRFHIYESRRAFAFSILSQIQHTLMTWFGHDHIMQC